MKFRPQLAEHSVRRLRITHAELSAAGVTVTFDNVLEPAIWKDAIDLRVGDEIEVIGTNFERTVKVISLGPEGASVEHISGQPSAPRAATSSSVASARASLISSRSTSKRAAPGSVWRLARPRSRRSLKSSRD
jgi:hypothetical protein